MEKNIHFFDAGKAVKKEEILETIGTRGREAMELASLSLPLSLGLSLIVLSRQSSKPIKPCP
jgi:hypothetical protein